MKPGEIWQDYEFVEGKRRHKYQGEQFIVVFCEPTDSYPGQRWVHGWTASGGEIGFCTCGNGWHRKCRRIA